MKYEHREWYDNYGTGNYTEDKENRFCFDITVEKAMRFAELWTSIGCKYYETSKAFFFEKEIDARHYTQYIIYKQ